MLRHLDLGRNMLETEDSEEGHSIYDLTLLEYLDLSQNRLGTRQSEYTIPSTIGNMTNLRGELFLDFLFPFREKKEMLSTESDLTIYCTP